MNRRTEPRSNVYALAQVARLEAPETEISGNLLDVSSAGVRLALDEALAEDQIIAIETDQHLILAEVRHCNPRGTRFSVGAERLHAMAKLFLPHGVSRSEQIQALIEDYHRRLNDALTAAPAESVQRKMGVAERMSGTGRYPATGGTPVLVPTPIRGEARAVISEPPAPEPPTWEPSVSLLSKVEPSSDPLPFTPVRSLAEEHDPPTAGVFLLKPIAAAPAGAKPEAVTPLSFPAAPMTAISDAALLPEVPLADLASIEEATAVEEAALPSEEATAAPAPVTELVADPIRVAALRSASEATPAAKKDSRLRTGALVAAACVTVLALGALLYGPSGQKSPALQSTAVAQAPVAAAKPLVVESAVPPAAPKPVAPAAAPPPAPASASAPAPAAPAAARDGKLSALLQASDRSWVTACVDGKILFSKLLVAGSRDELRFARSAVVRMGSAGPVQIALGGKSIGELGTTGQVRVVELSASGFRFFSGGEPEDCTQTH